MKTYRRRSREIALQALYTWQLARGGARVILAPAKTLDKPESELKAFAKTNLLQPGQSQVLTFTLRAADLASYDTPRAAWVAEAGTYTVKAGASSSDIRQQATFDLPQELVVAHEQNVLMPKVEIHERTPARQ